MRLSGRLSQVSQAARLTQEHYVLNLDEADTKAVAHCCANSCDIENLGPAFFLSASNDSFASRFQQD